MVIKRPEQLPDYPEYLHFVPRTKWSVDEPTWEEPPPLNLPVSHVRLISEDRIVCNDEKRCKFNLQKFQKKMMHEEQMEDIPYNFIIGETGIIFEGRGWFTDAERDDKHKYLEGKCVDIALVGRYDNKKHKPPRVIASALEGLIEYAQENELLIKGYKEIGFNN